MDSRGNNASRTLTVGGTRLLEYTLAVGIFLGSFALWILVPVGSLWIGSLIANDATTMMLCVLIICPVAML
ncbi:MAG: hypothetical protein QOF65_1329, partial [Thermoleophilaceae bacterium]|nr:hypothetical protein [Thermoleophilaceae bacterium]